MPAKPKTKGLSRYFEGGNMLGVQRGVTIWVHFHNYNEVGQVGTLITL